MDTGETNEIGRPYTKKILVNGNVKPVSEDVLLEVLDVFTNPNNKVVDHTFLVDMPEYVGLSLTVNLNVYNELVESDVESVVQAVFDGGAPVDSLEFDGLSIGETLFKNSIVSALEIFPSYETTMVVCVLVLTHFISLFFKQYGTTSFFKVFDSISCPSFDSYHLNDSISSDVLILPFNSPLYLKT